MLALRAFMRLRAGWKESVEDPTQNPAKCLFGEDFRLKVALENQARDNRSQCYQREIVVCFLQPRVSLPNSWS